MIGLTILVAVLGLALGAGLVGWRSWLRRGDPEAAARRSHVLHELAEGDVENVAHTLEQIAEAEPGDQAVFLALAALDRRRGRVERAKAIHRTVLAAAELAPELRVAGFVGLGRDLLAQGHHEAAVGALSRAISLAPQSVATLESLARALEQAGAWDRAAAAWERHEKLVPARRRRDSRIGRGHAVAGQALAALVEGDVGKAGRLIERALELAPDSGHVWTTKARVAVAAGATGEAGLAWQRAWELTPAAAQPLIAEALTAAAEAGHGGADELYERMQASLRTAEDPTLVVALAQRVASRSLARPSGPDPTSHATPAAIEVAMAALQRVRQRSPAATLSLIRLLLAHGQQGRALEIAMMDSSPSTLVCRACAREMPRFRFRCDDCGAWDSATTIDGYQGLGPGLASRASASRASASRPSGPGLASRPSGPGLASRPDESRRERAGRDA